MPASAKRFSEVRVLAVVAAALLAALIVLLPQNNDRIAAALATFWASVAYAACDALFLPKNTRIVRVICALLVGGAIGNWFRLDAGYAFRVTFGVAPSTDVDDLNVHGLFVGRQSDQSLCVSFVTDDAAFLRLRSQRPFERDRQAESLLLVRVEMGDNWKDTVFGADWMLGGSDWLTLEQSESMEIYRWCGGDSGIEQAVVLWAPQTGRVFALYMFG